MVAVGTKVYYTGDVANHEGWFTVTKSEYGKGVTVEEIPGELSFNRNFQLMPVEISHTYDGTGRYRFVTKVAYDRWRQERIEAMKAQMEAVLGRGGR